MTSSGNSLTGASAVALAALIRRKEASPLEVVDAHIARIEAVNPRLNAVVAQRFDAARREAKAAAQLLARGGEAPPFLGVPCTVKEPISLEGMPNTSGSHFRRGLVAPRDAVAVERLKAAGFIPLGVTNVPECCFGPETHNVVYGRTRNPHDLSRTAGGSSGGEGAIIAARGSPLGIGSDIGGSIRMPALFNGIFGHKPSGGLVPLTGHYPFYATAAGAAPGPFAWTGDRGQMYYNTIGPLARHAEDLMPVLRALSGRDGFDASCLDLTLRDPAAVGWKGRKVVVFSDPDFARARRPAPAIRAAVEAAAAHLAAQGALVEPLERGKMRNAFNMWAAAMHQIAMPHLNDLLTGGAERRLVIAWEVLRMGARAGRHTLASMQHLVGERLYPVIRDKPGIVRAALVLAAEMEALLEGGGVLLMPAYPRAAPKHQATMFTPFDVAYSAVVNVLRLPATSIPMGVDEAGLPVGIQAVAGHGRDDVTIAAALELGAAFGGAPEPRGV